MNFKKSIIEMGGTLYNVVQFNYTHTREKKTKDLSVPEFNIEGVDKYIVHSTRNTSSLNRDVLRINPSLKTTNKFYIINTSKEEFQFKVNNDSYDSTAIKRKIQSSDIENFLYIMVYELYISGKASEALEILTISLKDKYLTKAVMNAFTAKERQRCAEVLLMAAHNKNINLQPKIWGEPRLLEGELKEDDILDNGPCLMELLEVFEKNGDKFIPLDLEHYKRIGKKVVDNYNAFKQDKAVKLTADFSDLVFTKEKLNISIRYEIPGFVTINPRQAKAVGFTNNIFSGKIYREQTIIKDGEVNIEKFHILASVDTVKYLKALNTDNLYTLIYSKDYSYVNLTLVEIDISKLPVLNKRYISKCDSLDYILDTYYEERAAECRQKVINYFIKKIGKKFICKGPKYTRAQKELLKSFGLEDGIYEGIDNKVLCEGSNKYECRFFEFGLKGFSEIPKVEDILIKIREGNKKFNGSETLMVNYIKYLEENKFHTSIDRLNCLLEEQKLIIRSNTRKLAQIKLAKTLTGGWWEGLKLDSRGNYFYERDDKTLVIKVVRKTINI